MARMHFVKLKGTFRVECIFINDAISLDFRAQSFPLIFPYENTFKQQVPLLCIVKCRE